MYISKRNKVETWESKFRNERKSRYNVFLTDMYMYSSFDDIYMFVYLFVLFLQASFNFCKNLTGKSVLNLLTKCPALVNLYMSGTSVASLPQSLGE